MRNHLHPLATCILCLVAATAPRAAHAVEPAEATAEAHALTDKAGALYDEGVVAFRKSKWAEARAAFLAAWSLKQHWQIAANLADCELQLGRFREAAEHATYYVRNAPADRRARGEKLLTAAKAKVGVLTVQVDPPDAEVLVDGVTVGRAPLAEPVFVEPGTRRVSARLSGRLEAAKTVELGAASSQVVVLKLAPASSGSPVLPPPNPPVGSGAETRKLNRTVLIAGGAVAGVALVGGVVFTLLSNGKASDADAKLAELRSRVGEAPCASGKLPEDCAALLGLNKASDTFHNLAVAGYIGAGVAGLATVAYAFWPAGKNEPPRVVTLAPMVGGGAGGLMVGAKF